MSSGAEIVIGQEAGMRVLGSVRRARHGLLILSPWLSPSTAELAVRKQNEGVETSIVTTDYPTPSHRRALLRLIRTAERVTRPARRLLEASGLIAIVAGLLALMLHSLGSIAFPVAGGLIAAGLAAYLLGRPRRERYLVPRVSSLRVYRAGNPLLHAKLYVADSTVIVGSPNFTVTGLKKSVESVAILEDPELALSVRSEVDALARTPLQEVPLSALVPAPLGVKSRPEKHWKYGTVKMR